MLKLPLTLILLRQWGRTPLIIAALNNFQEIAKLLLKAGASINAQDKAISIYIVSSCLYSFALMAIYVCMYVGGQYCPHIGHSLQPQGDGGAATDSGRCYIHTR